MVKMTCSLSHWLVENHPEVYMTVSFGHVEDITEEMWHQYLAWCCTKDGREYLEGGKHYKPPE